MIFQEDGALSIWYRDIQPSFYRDKDYTSQPTCRKTNFADALLRFHDWHHAFLPIISEFLPIYVCDLGCAARSASTSYNLQTISIGSSTVTAFTSCSLTSKVSHHPAFSGLSDLFQVMSCFLLYLNLMATSEFHHPSNDSVCNL